MRGEALNRLGGKSLPEEKEAEENKENVDASKDKENEAGKKKVEHEISEGNVATAAAAALASAATKAKVCFTQTAIGLVSSSQ